MVRYEHLILAYENPSTVHGNTFNKTINKKKTTNTHKFITYQNQINSHTIHYNHGYLTNNHLFTIPTSAILFLHISLFDSCGRRNSKAREWSQALSSDWLSPTFTGLLPTTGSGSVHQVELQLTHVLVKELVVRVQHVCFVVMT